jgi:cell division protein ZapA
LTCRTQQYGEDMSDTTTVSVKILDKEYQVSCRQDEVDALTASARYLDQQMRQIRESGKVFGLDRIAVMTALNLANELLQKRHAVDDVQLEADVMVRQLTDRITEALAEHKQLGF